jgi:hypothetical protein
MDASTPSLPDKASEMVYLPLVLQESIFGRTSGATIVSRSYGKGANQVNISISGGVHKGKRLLAPSGRIGRLLFYWLIREARHNKNPLVSVLGSKAIFSELGLTRTSYQIRKFKEELKRLAYMSITIEKFNKIDGSVIARPNIPVFDYIGIWDTDGNSEQLPLFKSGLRFSDTFYEAILKSGEGLPPIRLEPLREIKSALGMDIYVWAQRRAYTIRSSLLELTWEAVKEQFGQSGETTSNFKKLFPRAYAQAMRHMDCWDGVAGWCDKEGVYLRKCDSQIAPIPEPQKGWS